MSVRRYAGNAPKGAIIVRIVRAGDQIAGFIREVDEPGDDDSTYPTEQKPIDQVWRVVRNKLDEMPDTPVFVEVEAGIDWDPAWGTLLD